MHALRCCRVRCGVVVTSCLLVAGVLTGCSGRKTYPVEGRIHAKDGAFAVPGLAGYLVMFESVEQPVSASGVVQPDGTFRLGTFREGDGAVVGKHRVALTPPLEEEGKPRPKKLLAERYQRFETSGLEVEVKAQTNEITFELEGLKR